MTLEFDDGESVGSGGMGHSDAHKRVEKPEVIIKLLFGTHSSSWGLVEKLVPQLLVQITLSGGQVVLADSPRGRDVPGRTVVLDVLAASLDRRWVEEASRWRR